MRAKRPVYNGYEEKYATGAELTELFEGQYLTSGRHHSVVLGVSIPDYLWYLGIVEEKTYRLFLNDFFCRIMKGDTDGLISFFGHTKLQRVKLSHQPEEIKLHKFCPNCGERMAFKQGKYGEFLGCTGYPDCRFTEKVPILGNTVLDIDAVKKYWNANLQN